MIDKVSDIFTNLLIKHKIINKDQYSDFDYVFRIILFNFIVIGLLLFFNIWFDSCKELLVIGIVCNMLRRYSGGFHMPTFEKCILFTVPYITIIAVFAKHTIDYPLHILFLSVILSILIIKKIPMVSTYELKTEDIKPNSFYINKYINLVVVFYIINFTIVLMKLRDLNFISTSISFGTIAVSLSMFKTNN